MRAARQSRSTFCCLVKPRAGTARQGRAFWLDNTDGQDEYYVCAESPLAPDVAEIGIAKEVQQWFGNV
ncbi:hypothetical protein RGR602_CH01964 [Rhizobium gallicum bv. gallicum R602sp]|uniref:Uncharacterized protein n=1 Tax=Rhizobium gallicum bv. gallicum R602sp TaxID=1041138 RepID=A0A0B4X024_9HYPH|nr:hypothetical protein RGR602_CH01964 [Rhizobium gallicum bv. gallicum R602sp]